MQPERVLLGNLARDFGSFEDYDELVRLQVFLVVFAEIHEQILQTHDLHVKCFKTNKTVTFNATNILQYNI